MQIVIDIPDKKWELIQSNEYCGIIDDLLFQNIKNGTPLAEVIENIMAEIDEKCDCVKRDNIYCSEGLEMALEIIKKHISGKEKE